MRNAIIILTGDEERRERSSLQPRAGEPQDKKTKRESEARFPSLSSSRAP